MKNIIKLWNTNFEKGVTVFQMCLMAMMIYAGIVGNQTLVLFTMFNVLIGYFEPTNNRFSFAKDEQSLPFTNQKLNKKHKYERKT